MKPLYTYYDHETSQTEGLFTYCPRCATPLEARQVGNCTRPACPECGFVQYRNPAPTVAIVILNGDQVLLGKRRGEPGEGKWATPSGYIEFGEDFITTAIREAREETGLEVAIISVLNLHSSFLSPRFHFFNAYLLARVTGGDLNAGDDMLEVAWFPLAGPLPEMAYQEDLDMLGELCRGVVKGLAD